MPASICFIVSAYDRPNFLRCCLASLWIQTPQLEIVVTDNNPPYNRDVAMSYGGYIAGVKDAGCYDMAEIAAKETTAEWLCFPSDDSYYVPKFGSIMLCAAAENKWDFVYCDMLYDPRWIGRYAVMPVRPEINHIDKTCFIVKRELFLQVGGFPPHANDFRDGALAERLVREPGVRHGKAPGCLVVHN